MDVTTKDISDWALTHISKLAASGLFTSDSNLYRTLGTSAGLSFQTVRQFHLGLQPNLSMTTLDNLVAAIKGIQQRVRAA